MQFEDAVVRLRRDGATLVVFTGIDTNFTPVFRGFRGKVAIYNENIRAIADRYDCIVADQWALKEVQDPRFFDPDRLHYNSLGHHEVARMVLRALNVPNDLQPMQPDPLPVRTWRAGAHRGLRLGAHALRALGAAPGAPRVLGRRRSRRSDPTAMPVTTLAPARDSAASTRSARCTVRLSAPDATVRRSAQSATAAAAADIERVDAARHRNRHDRVRDRMARRLSPSPSEPRAGVRPARDGRPRTPSRPTASSDSASAASGTRGR